MPGTDGQLQIMTSIHDGFHTTSASVGPIMTNCTYIGAGGVLHMWTPFQSCKSQIATLALS